ncbi:hypothetical protein [Sporohalobacter salinus]|uniref:hypothetical protein n=1 Tax=Sporohalobacter salinus TaxID=1494606 RepID=UPI0019607746|nr:hypothetical protein [Sporohalobacter salinus]MBM7624934.1 small-conductance mechanosensitive channel [Sporohalobacter salinus]
MKKQRNFKVDIDEWEIFKKNCQENDTNASVELRKFINRYNKENREVTFNFDEALEKITEDRSELLQRLSE